MRKVLARITMGLLGEIAPRQFAWVPSPAVVLYSRMGLRIGGLSRAIPVSHAAPKFRNRAHKHDEAYPSRIHRLLLTSRVNAVPVSR